MPPLNLLEGVQEPERPSDSCKAQQAHVAATAEQDAKQHTANGRQRARTSPSPPVSNNTAAESSAAVNNPLHEADPTASSKAGHGSSSNPAAGPASAHQNTVLGDCYPHTAAGSSSPATAFLAALEGSQLAMPTSAIAIPNGTGSTAAGVVDAGSSPGEAQPIACTASGKTSLQRVLQAAGQSFRWPKQCESLLSWASLLQDSITAVDSTLTAEAGGGPGTAAAHAVSLQQQFDDQLKQLAASAMEVTSLRGTLFPPGAKGGTDAADSAALQTAAGPAQVAAQPPLNPATGVKDARAFVEALDRAQGLANQATSAILQLIEALIRDGDEECAFDLSQRLKVMLTSATEMPLAVASPTADLVSTAATASRADVMSSSAEAKVDIVRPEPALNGDPDGLPNGNGMAITGSHRAVSEDPNAKRKRKRIEWDAKTAAASSAAALKAAASASAAQHQLNAAAPQQQPSVSRPRTPSSELPSPARQKRKAIQWDPEAATAAEVAPQLQRPASAQPPAPKGTKPLEPASQQQSPFADAPIASGLASSSPGTDAAQANQPAASSPASTPKALSEQGSMSQPLWAGSIQWSWAQETAVKGSFKASLVDAGAFPLGSKCPAKGNNFTIALVYVSWSIWYCCQNQST